MVPHHPGLTIKVFAKSGSTQCILLIKCFKRTKQDIGKTRDTELKFQLYLGGGMKQKKEPKPHTE